MSTTFTVHQIEEVLGDYKIQLTGAEENNIEPPSSSEPPRATNPSNWPTDRRRIPDFRPVDRNRDAEGRPNGTVLPERIFLTLMFTGVVVNAVSMVYWMRGYILIYEQSTAKLWGATGGPYLPRLFRYAIGGEW